MVFSLVFFHFTDFALTSDNPAACNGTGGPGGATPGSENFKNEHQKAKILLKNFPCSWTTMNSGIFCAKRRKF